MVEEHHAVERPRLAAQGSRFRVVNQSWLEQSIRVTAWMDEHTRAARQGSGTRPALAAPSLPHGDSALNDSDNDSDDLSDSDGS